MKVFVVLACYNDYDESEFCIGVGATREWADYIVKKHKEKYERSISSPTTPEHRKQGYQYTISGWEVKQ